MCGISAIFSLKQKLRSIDTIVPMTDLIRHRGPDDAGYTAFCDKRAFPFQDKDTPEEVLNSSFAWTPKNFNPSDEGFWGAFGHRRLSVIDLSPAGHQPMCLPDGSLWITYNGEIYNFPAIREELRRMGRVFTTQSDTEVILHAYQQWGKNCLHRFNGMFAFAIYDPRKKELFAARDRFGVKPLYYWFSPEGFLALASEIKQLTVLPGWRPRVNRQRAYDFLAWGHLDHTNETLFQDVRQLRGGEMMTFSPEEGEMKIEHWYTLKRTPFTGSFSEAALQYHSLLESAVDLRLRADVDVGSCLSGGLDSSSIVCLANRLLDNREERGKQKTFSACSDIARFDEKAFVNMVTSSIQVEPFYTYPSLEGLFETCSQKIVWNQDEPFSSTSIYSQWRIFEAVSERRVKVMLDGQGADEQLCGYTGFFGNHFYDLFRGFRWKAMADEMNRAKKAGLCANPHLLLGNKLVPDFIRQPLRKVFGKTSAHVDWLDNNRIVRADPLRDLKGHSVDEQSMVQILYSSLPKLLHYEDRDSMAHGVESRTPFLDYRLVEFTLGLPSDYKISGGWTKRVLREGMKNIIPEGIRTRIDKMGFVTPEEVWCREHQPELFLKHVRQAQESSYGLINEKACSFAEKVIKGKKAYDHTLWRIISFGHWMERFTVGIE